MNFSAEMIAGFLNGTIEGDPKVEVNNIAKIEEGKHGMLSFLANPKYNSYLYTTESSIVLVNKDFVPEKDVKATLIRVDNAYESFASLLELYQQNRFQESGISANSFIAESAEIGENLFLGHFSTIGNHVKIGNNVKIHNNVSVGDNVTIGDNTEIRSGVSIYYDTIIGKSCYIHSGTVVGAEGFGFAPQSDGKYKKIPQVGNVVLGDFVEIGANSCIDRATMGSTRIADGVKIDNLVQIAHNVEIGNNTVIAAQTGVSGSTKIGKNCMIAGQVGIVGHLTISDGTIIAAQAGLSNNVKVPGKVMQGSPAMELRNFQKSSVYFKKLPELAQKIQELEKALKALEIDR
ncbi:MAG: UDP-3-O-(3-hydroxymyristoyl)glucosamine N-acyltransferase [Bacteroidales bacterium]|nr:UDP-3-O-(3-hydroxymyristoyl)glucosamine N-acyltransferase [Bacteroidales bacterium]